MVGFAVCLIYGSFLSAVQSCWLNWQNFSCDNQPPPFTLLILIPFLPRPPTPFAKTHLSFATNIARLAFLHFDYIEHLLVVVIIVATYTSS